MTPSSGAFIATVIFTISRQCFRHRRGALYLILDPYSNNDAHAGDYCDPGHRESRGASLLNPLPVFPSLATNSATSPSVSITCTSPSSAPDSTQQTNTAAIAGGTIDGLAVIAGVLLAFWCSRRRRRSMTIRYPKDEIDQEMQ
jgi:hypothetical protein